MINFVRYISYVAVFFVINSAHANEVSGEMSCILKTADVLTVIDSEHKKNNGLKNLAIVGDKIKIKYSYSLEKNEFSFYTLEDHKKLENWDYYFSPFYLVAKGNDESKLRVSDRYKEILHDDKSNFFELRGDVINAVISDRWSQKTSRLSLYRYSKHDWSGVGYIMNSPLQLFSYTLNCRDKSDAFDSIIEQLRNQWFGTTK